MSSDNQIPLDQWLTTVRQQLSRAIQTRKESGDDEDIDLELTELVLEATVVTSNSDSQTLAGTLMVLTGDLSKSSSKNSTQKMTMRFRPSRSDGPGIMLGDEEPTAMPNFG